MWYGGGLIRAPYGSSGCRWLLLQTAAHTGTGTRHTIHYSFSFFLYEVARERKRVDKTHTGTISAGKESVGRRIERERKKERLRIIKITNLL